MRRYNADRIALVLNVISIISFVGILFSGLFSWTAVVNVCSAVGILCFLVGLFLLLRYPDIFAAATKKELEKKGLSGQYVGIMMPLSFPGCAATFYMTRNANPQSWWELVLAAAILCAVLGILLWCFSAELRSKPGELIGLAFLLALCQVGNIWQANVLLDFQEPDYAQVEVIDKDTRYRRKGGTTYYFNTELDGEEFQFNVSSAAWDDLRPGTTVTIAIHSGGLGMEYYTLEEP